MTDALLKTARLYYNDPMMREATADVLHAGDDGVVLNRSPFYPRAGGQPGDGGVIAWPDGEATVLEARPGIGTTVFHVLAPGAVAPPVGAGVVAWLDWPRRWQHMRMHTALHLLCALLPGAGVTGGQIGADKSRLDLDLPEPPDKAALEEGFARLVAADLPVTTRWVDESVLDTDPGLVRTLSVKPPRGAGRLRLVCIGDPAAPTDLQPCGGTHVGSTALVGRVRVLKIENKGRQNRRIAIGLEDA